MRLEFPDGVGVNAHGPLPATLRRTLDPLALHHADRTADPDRRRFPVDVSPAQVQQLPASRAGVRGQPVERAESVVCHQTEKQPKLIGSPDFDGRPSGTAGTLRTISRVGREDALELHGVVEGFPQYGMHLVDSCPRQRFASTRPPLRRS